MRQLLIPANQTESEKKARKTVTHHVDRIADNRPSAEISAMYIGDTTDALLIAKLPMNRENRNEAQLQGNARCLGRK